MKYSSALPHEAIMPKSMTLQVVNRDYLTGKSGIAREVEGQCS
jgi:hypothetical protein